MGKNKSPRKKYRPRPVLLPFIPRKKLEVIESLLNNIALAVEIKLPRGLFDEQDLFALRDFLNWVGFSMMTRQYVDPEHYGEAAEIQRSAADALGAMVRRTNKLTRENKRTGKTFVPTGGELRAIQEGIAYFLSPMRETLWEEPKQLLREFEAMKIYMREHGTDGVFDSVQVKNYE